MLSDHPATINRRSAALCELVERILAIVHDEPDAFSGQDYWPEALGQQTFYEPTERGFEREVRGRLETWKTLRRERRPADL